MDDAKPGISLTMPKTNVLLTSPYLFPFFFNMLPEGSNKKAICKSRMIDEDDYFGLLLEIAKNDTIGAVRVIHQ
jgi:serine/threonine-protein kinase HipA